MKIKQPNLNVTLSWLPLPITASFEVFLLWEKIRKIWDISLSIAKHLFAFLYTGADSRGRIHHCLLTWKHCAPSLPKTSQSLILGCCCSYSVSVSPSIPFIALLFLLWLWAVSSILTLAVIPKPGSSNLTLLTLAFLINLETFLP